MELWDYQIRASEFGLNNPSTYFAIDMGMGKTAITLRMISESKQKAMVFGPLRPICSSWPEEIAKWAPHLSYRICHGKDRHLNDLDKVDILLMNYEGLDWLSKQTASWRRRMVVYDESSMVKSHSTNRFKLLTKMGPFWTDYKICLSATPAPNSLADLWAQYYLLDRGQALGKNISEFRRNYCSSFAYPGMNFVKYDVMPSKYQEIYDRVAPLTFRLDAKDYLTMPELIHNEVVCDLPSSLRKKYDELENKMFVELEDTNIVAFSEGAASLKLRQFVQGGIYDENKNWIRLHQEKIAVLKEIVNTAAGHPVLCAIQFKGELQMIRDAFGGKVPVIAGGVSPKEAMLYIKMWNEGALPLLLCHPASLSHGLNLQHGGHILVFYALPWNYEHYFQLIGRLYRQGQTTGVAVHHIIMRNTIDELIMIALRKKDTQLSSLLTYLKEYKHEHRFAGGTGRNYKDFYSTGQNDGTHT